MKEVSLLSFSFSTGEDGANPGEEGILKLIDKELEGNEDIVLLPENCTGPKIYEEDDAFLKAVSGLAGKHKVYILCPISRKVEENKTAVSAYLFDRNGDAAFCYDKMYPYWKKNNEELEAAPGKKAVYCDTDFGRISAAICFDANFPALWEKISEKDVDLVVFASAYSAGRQLAAHALNHHYTIATCTRIPDFAVIDLAGREIEYKKGNKADILVSRARINLNKAICHYNFNKEKINKLINDYPGTIEVDCEMPREEWIILKSEHEELNLKKILKEYGIETLREYKLRSKKFINSHRNS